MEKRMTSIFAATLMIPSICLGLAGCSGNNVTASSSTASAPATSAVADSSAVSSSAETQDAVWNRIQKSGTIVLGSSGTYSPYTYFDKDNKITGFDVELTYKVAEKLGLKVKYVQTKWDSLIAGLQSDRLDIVANQVAITDERKKSVDFSDPYSYLYPSLAVKTDSSIKSFDDLKGKVVCTNLTTVFAPLAQSFGAKVVSNDGEFAKQIEILLSGRCDAAINDPVTFQQYLKEHPDAQVKVVDTYKKSATPIGFMVKKDSPVLCQKLNDTLAELKEEGVISQLAMQYLGVDVTK